MSTLQFQLDPPLVNVQSHLSAVGVPLTIDEAGNVDGDWDERKSNKDGYTAYQKVDAGTCTLLVRASGYRDVWLTVAMPHDELITITLEAASASPASPTISVLTRLHTQGQWFYNEHGERVYLRGASLFVAYWKWLEFGPESIVPAVSELQRNRCNAARVFCMSANMQQNEFKAPPMDPRRYGSRFYNESRSFLQYMASQGIYVYWSFGPDNGLIYTGAAQAELPGTFARFTEAIDLEPNNLMQYTNEQAAKDFNRVDGNSFRKPARIPCCLSQFGDEFGGDLPSGPILDFGDLETERGNIKKTIKDASTVDHPIATRLNKPVIVSEGDRYGSRGNLDLRLSTAAAGASLYGAGYFFHSMNGERCEPFDDQTRPIAEATFRVLAACEAV